MAEAGLPEDMATLKAAAREALGAGRWEEARKCFAALLEIEQSGEALFGLALALWWLGDPVSSISLQERAFGMFRRDGDYENAFFAAGCELSKVASARPSSSSEATSSTQ